MRIDNSETDDNGRARTVSHATDPFVNAPLGFFLPVIFRKFGIQITTSAILLYDCRP